MLVDSMARRLIRFGRLEIALPGGRVAAAEGREGPRFRVRLRGRRDALRLPFRRTLALAEAYMGGRLEIEEGGSLYDLLAFLAANAAEAPASPAARALRAAVFPFRRLQQWNTAGRAKSFIGHHYDIPDEIYDTFLDRNRQYSCAWFRDDGATLDEAQEEKMRRIAAKLLLRQGQRVLDVGCGWGGLACHLAARHGVDVDGLTLSERQLKGARARARAEGLDGRARFELRDYRAAEGVWDRIVSVGMFEHVGVAFYRTFFRVIARSLAGDGAALLHTIGRSDGPGITDPFIRRHIFPGGYIPALSEMLPAIERAGLMVTDVEVLRLHYAKTLRHWRERFLAARDRVLEVRDERFLRMWEFYLAGSEVAFRFGGMVVFQIQMAKRVDALPLSRSYMDGGAAPG